MGNRILQHGFLGGEIAPSLFARTDLDSFKQSADTIENFYILPQGAIRARQGFEYIGKALNSAKDVRLIPFIYSTDQSFCLEFGDYTMRVISNGGYVVDSNNNVLQVTTPYSADMLKTLEFSQNADIITICSTVKSPYELRRYSNTDWRFTQISFTPSVSAPTITSVTPIYASYMTTAEAETKDKITSRYVVTAVDKDEKESIASNIVSGRGNFYISGAKMRIEWNAVNGASRYNVYREVSGIYGYIGETSNTYLEDSGNNPNTSTTPPRYKNIFDGENYIITNISVTNKGSGYDYGLIDNVTYLPNALTIPMTSGEYTNNYLAFENAKGVLNFVVTDNNNTLFSSTISVTTVQQDSISTWSINKTEIDTSSLKGTNIKITLTSAYNYDEKNVEDTSFSNQTTIAKIIFGDNVADELSNGVTIARFLEIFPQQTRLTLPLTITDSSGSGASASCFIVGGEVVSVNIQSFGSNYTTSTTCQLNNSVGSDASFKVTVTKESSDIPCCVTQFDQRRVFGGSSDNPLKAWFTNSGEQSLMSYHIPTMATDRIIIDCVTNNADRIKHAVALESLIFFTSSSELRVWTQNSDSLTPSSVAVKTQSYVGANDVQPIVINSTIVYCASRGGHVHILGYDYNKGGYISQDISIKASHLFDNKTLKALTCTKSPLPNIYLVSSDGSLLVCTFAVDQNICAWSHFKTTDGKFLQVCAIAEGNEDHLYAVIERGDVKYIERLSDYSVDNPNDYSYVDSFLHGSFSTPTKYINGLSHLKEKEVAVFVDGKQQSNKIVNEQGIITLDAEGYNVTVGLPIEATLVTVPLVVGNAEGGAQGRNKNISELFIRKSYGGDIWSNNYPNDNLWQCNINDVYNDKQNNQSQVVKLSLNGSWEQQGQIIIKHKDALPLEIQSLVYNTSFEN